MGKDRRGKELGPGISQRSNGKYCARYVDRFGKRKSLYDDSLESLKTRLLEARYNNTFGRSVINKDTTLDKWFDKWIDNYKNNLIKPNTELQYRNIYTKHISPWLGSHSLTDITRLDVQELLKRTREHGYGYATQNRIRILLQDMYDKALLDDFVTKNIARGIRVPSNDKKERRVLSPDEQVDFFECSQGTFYDNLFRMAILTGMRAGELCGLMMRDIDLEQGIISVSRTLIYQKLPGDTEKQFHFGVTKTSTSTRRIPIKQECKDVILKQLSLKRIVEEKSPKSVDEEFKDLLFVTKFNTPINDVLFCGAINKVIEEINLQRTNVDAMLKFSPHCFRHTFATNCYNAGMDMKTLSDIMGHASLHMTMDLYTHISDEKRSLEIDKMYNHKVKSTRDKLKEIRVVV